MLNSEDVFALRNTYKENMKWQFDNYDPIERWLLTKLKFDVFEKDKYMDCVVRAKHGTSWWKLKRKRKLIET